MTRQIPYALEISFDMKNFITIAQKYVRTDTDGYSAHKALDSFKEEVSRELSFSPKCQQVLVVRNLETDTIVERIISTGEILK